MHFFCTALIAAITASAGAANVYILSSGDPTLDAQVRSVLIAGGHTATIGVAYTDFDGTQSLTGFQAVYLQANYNWSTGDMPMPGQGSLLAFVSDGGGLVTSEWVIWKAAAQGSFTSLAAAFPAQMTNGYNSNATAQYDRATPDATLNAGLPTSFTFPLTNIAGAEVNFTARPGATVFYHSALSTFEGLIGGTYGAGHVLNFSSTCGPATVGDANFAILLANAFRWTGTGTCYPNCDGSTLAPILNVADFTCFLNRFASGDTYANCDSSTTAPTLNVADFICFLNRFGQGC